MEFCRMYSSTCFKTTNALFVDNGIYLAKGYLQFSIEKVHYPRQYSLQGLFYDHMDMRWQKESVCHIIS